MMAAMTIAAIPPMIPPAIAPVLDGEPLLEEWLESGDVSAGGASAGGVAVLAAVEEVVAENNGKRLFSLACSILVYRMGWTHSGRRKRRPTRGLPTAVVQDRHIHH